MQDHFGAKFANWLAGLVAGNLVPRASVAFPQKASRPADTPGKRRPDLDKFCLAQTDVLRPLKFARSHRAGSVEELTVGVHCLKKSRAWQWLDGAVKTFSELSS